MKDYTYQIVIFKESEDPGYYGICPQLPGCNTDGDTIEETILRMNEAIQLYLETLVEIGQTIPEPDGSRPIVIASTTVSLAA